MYKGCYTEKTYFRLFSFNCVLHKSQWLGQDLQKNHTAPATSAVWFLNRWK
jgi:hypothetical protein